MAVPDITALTLTELQELLTAAQAQLAAIRVQQAQDDRDSRSAISAAITSLTTLLGPADAPPGTGSINAVLGYDAATMGENAGLALHLAFEGMKILTETTLNIANVMGTKE